MNRLIKGIIYITIGCVGMGAAAVVLGLVLGGGKVDLSNDDMYHRAKNAVNVIRDLASKAGRRGRTSHISMDTSKEIEVSEENAAVVDQLEQSSGLAEVYMDSFDYDDAGYDYHLLTAGSDEVQNLQIDLRHGEFDIEESEDNMIRVFLDGSPDAIKAECADGKLAIKDYRQGSSSRKDAYIYLQIPKGIQFDDIDMQVDAGVVDAGCVIKALRLSLHADAADISVSDLDVDTLDVSVGTGVVDIQEGRFGAVDLDCGVGEIDLTASSISRDSKISCGMGAVDIEMEEDTDSFNYIVSCGMGGIEIGDNDYSGLAKARKIDNGAAATITLDCGMGSISIN